ncbi:MAG TPA: nickel-binding protein [Methylibium sp.]
MTDILVERHWDQALSDADLQAALASAGECLGIHRVNWHSSRLSADGHELFCHFSAADAESVRIALSQSGSPRGQVWAGTVHDAPGVADADLARVNVLACRRFDSPTSFEAADTPEQAGASCLLTHRVTRVRSYLSADRKRMVSLYQAPDAESVRLALQAAGVAAERVWAFRQFRP